MAQSVQGAYFMADDESLDLTIAFLNSFRRHNPSLPLCVIPFSNNVAQLISLRDSYDFNVYDRDDLLNQCDRLSQEFYGQTIGQFRKLAMWEGIFEEFVYIDVDTVILCELSRLFSLLAEYEFIASLSNNSCYKRWVWKNSISEVTALSRDQVDFAASTGFLISKRGAITLQIASSKLREALSLSPHMELLCAEQAFLNYLIVTSSKRYTSLLSLFRHSRTDLPLEYWGGDGSTWVGRISNGTLEPKPRGPLPLLVHWAGVWRTNVHKSNPLWLHYRYLHSPK